MLPRWHILYGALFVIVIWLFVPNINPLYLIIIFLSSVIIDLDSYTNAIIKTKKIRGKKGDFRLFHTIEFHILIAIISLFFTPFLYVFIGMVFHSLLDAGEMLYRDQLYGGEFLLSSYFFKRFNLQKS